MLYQHTSAYIIFYYSWAQFMFYCRREGGGGVEEGGGGVVSFVYIHVY